jgi:hypothetical protein
MAVCLNSDILKATALARSAGPCSPLHLSQPSFRVITLKIQAASLSAKLVPVDKLCGNISYKTVNFIVSAVRT